MGTENALTRADSGYEFRIWLGFALLTAGFLGHVFAARAIGGSHLAYRDHLAGFFGLTLISGAIIAGLGWKFWKGRPDITILAIGLLVYIERFSVHG
jgi:hypothetical protein